MRDKKIGLALGGGAVLGAAHIGVLQAIEEHKLKISAISGTSIGAIIAALYAFGKTPEQIKKIALDIDWKNLSSLTLSKYGVLSNDKIGKQITDNLEDVDFKDAKIPLNIVATDIATGKKVILNSGSVKEAVMASSCIPGIFVPIEIEDTLLVDGGLVENVPVEAVKEFDIDYIMAVNLNAGHSHKKPDGLVEVLLNTFDFVLNASTNLQIQDADFVICPDLSSFNAISTSQIEELIDAGYKYAYKQLKEIL